MSTLLNLDSYRHELYEQQQQLLAASPDPYTILSMDTPPTAATVASVGDSHHFMLDPDRSYASARSPSSSSASPSSPGSIASPSSRASTSMSPQSSASDHSASYTLQNLTLSGNSSSMQYSGVGIGYPQQQQQQQHQQHQQQQQQQLHQMSQQHQQQQQQHYYAPQLLCLEQDNLQTSYVYTVPANDAFATPKADYSKPHLVILEQPVDKFRFRYQSEMHGTHGSLMGIHTEKAKKTFPTVELRGYVGEAKVRCSLYQVDPQRRAPHSHHLVIKSGELDLIDPHDLDVGGPSGESSASGGGGYVATFQGMGIIHTAKKFIGEELYKKLRKHRLCELNREPTEREEQQMQKEAAVMARSMNLNQVCLCFQAYRVEPATGRWLPLCEPVYSNAINNMKSALTGELKICRLSTAISGVEGGEEVFMFVEKVCKNNIKIRFFELDEYDQEVWQDMAVFSEADVHHQYAIAFKTPPYRNKDIVEPVEVYMQLYRPRDRCQSEPVTFKYKPRPGMLAVGGGSGSGSRKRLRVSSGNVSGEIPTVIPNDPNGPGSAGGGGTGGGGGGGGSGINVGVGIGVAGSSARLPPLHQPFPMLASHGGSIPEEHEPSSTTVTTTTTTPHHQDILGASTASIARASIIQEILNIPTTIATDVAFDSSDFRCDSEEFNKLIQEIGNQQDLVKLETDTGTGDEATVQSTDSALAQAIGEFVASGDDAKQGEMLRKLLMLVKLFARDTNRSRQLLTSHWTASNQQQFNCLHAAIRRNDTTVATKLIELLVELKLAEELLDLPNDRNETALHLAVSINNVSIVEALLRAGAQLHYCDFRGNTALHRAVVENVPDMVRILLRHDHSTSRLDCTNDDGLTALQAAVYARNLKITRILIEAGAPVHEKDLKHGNNILHIAVDNDSLDIVNYILENVAHEVGRERNNAGYTPLQLANAKSQTGQGNNKLIVRELLRHDPDGLQYALKASVIRDSAEDGEDNEDEEDDEDEDEEEAEEGEAHRDTVIRERGPANGGSVLDSIDLSCDRANIARLLEEHEPESSDYRQQETQQERNGSTVSSGPSERSESALFDEKCLDELCRLLNVDGTWRELGSLLDFHAFFSVWEQVTDPARMLFGYVEMQNIPIDRVIELLRLLELRECIRCIDEMICRRMK
ncbi:nuclear factor NF-kappa-B p105 subunit-like [Anopheles nili]|uniref:nuclear factor NF-kappa-B p105 subunit-like n=1 Tax=Anopheles nili TaxID=185578 RepID=UPI00237A3AF7|nr:nuclear factor NF-kappa-B p105 subunit-like [Anopheles nili]